MIISIPATIKIAGFDYSINFVKHDKELQGDCAYGECSNVLRRIKVESGSTTQQETNKVFLHELLEALNCCYLDGQLTHEQIERLSYGLHQITEQFQLTFVQSEHIREVHKCKKNV